MDSSSDLLTPMISHQHSAGCGHVAIRHQDHVGYLDNGTLYCQIPKKKKDNAIDQHHEKADSISSNKDNSEFVFVKHRLSITDLHVGSSGDESLTSGDHHECGKQHSSAHIHKVGCGHEMVPHDDHFDFLVDDELHHINKDGTCVNHGTIKLMFQKLTAQHYCEENGEGVSRRFDRYARLILNEREDNDCTTDDKKRYRKSKKWWKDYRAKRFLSMLILTTSYFFIELIGGIVLGSLALQADAYHMASDIIALLVGFYAVQASKRDSTHIATYGWTRFEVLGALMNGTFLLATCFNITLEAIHRFYEADETKEKLTENVDLLIVVALIGLLVNLIGLCIFAEGHGHSHGGGSNHHGHSHSHSEGGVVNSKAHSHSHSEGGIVNSKAHSHSHSEGGVVNSKAHSHSHSRDRVSNHHGHGHSLSHSGHSGDGKSKRNLNIHGVFLHVLGDALGSVAVIFSGLFIKFTSFEWRFLADPLMSLVIVCIVSYSTLGLMRRCIRILLQQAPQHIDTRYIRSILMKFEGVLDIHDLHIWQLNDTKFIASLHVVCLTTTQFMKMSDRMKLVLHSFGIHSTTIQPEYVVEEETVSLRGREQCHEPVCAAKDCATSSCCQLGENRASEKAETPGSLRKRVVAVSKHTTLTAADAEV